MSRGQTRAVRLAQIYSREWCSADVRRRILAFMKGQRTEERELFEALTFALVARVWEA